MEHHLAFGQSKNIAFIFSGMDSNIMILNMAYFVVEPNIHSLKPQYAVGVIIGLFIL